MQFRDLDPQAKPTRRVFQRRNGRLRILEVPREMLDYSKKQTPMFPIVKDRDEKSS